MSSQEFFGPPLLPSSPRLRSRSLPSLPYLDSLWLLLFVPPGPVHHWTRCCPLESMSSFWYRPNKECFSFTRPPLPPIIRACETSLFGHCSLRDRPVLLGFTDSGDCFSQGLPLPLQRCNFLPAFRFHHKPVESRIPCDPVRADSSTYGPVRNPFSLRLGGPAGALTTCNLMLAAPASAEPTPFPG